MPTQMNATITQLGSLARTCPSPGQRGKVLAVFSKAIYLLTDVDELFWITTDTQPMHRRCAQISAPLPGLLAGSPFYVQDHRLTIDPDFVFHLGNASTWNVPHPDSVISVTDLPARIHSFFSSIDVSHAKGFGNFISQILSLSPGDFSDPLLRRAQPLVLDMASACLEHQPSRLPKIADRLIGLGAGLTPSGDDFLGGMFFALHHLQAAYPDSDFADFHLPLESYRTRTHLISYTLLNDLAHGYAVAPLHLLVNGLLMGEPFENIYLYVTQLTSIGHSTGWDLLTGLLVGLLAADSHHYQEDCFVGKYALLAMTKA